MFSEQRGRGRPQIRLLLGQARFAGRPAWVLPDAPVGLRHGRRFSRRPDSIAIARATPVRHPLADAAVSLDVDKSGDMAAGGVDFAIDGVEQGTR